MSNFNNITDGVNGVLKTVPEIYDDALKPAAKQMGKTLAIVPETVNALLTPLRKWNKTREIKLEFAINDLEEKLNKLPAEKLVEAPEYVVVPALQAMSYSMDCETLKKLFSNLLVSSMNVDTRDMVHPSFVEFIKQMSPMDAEIFKIIYQAERFPLMNIEVKRGESGHCIENYCTQITKYPLKQINISLNNLERLGLISTTFLEYYSDERCYDPIKNNPYFIRVVEETNSILVEDQQIVYEKGVAHLNGLSDLFYKICVEDS